LPIILKFIIIKQVPHQKGTFVNIRYAVEQFVFIFHYTQLHIINLLPIIPYLRRRLWKSVGKWNLISSTSFGIERKILCNFCHSYYNLSSLNKYRIRKVLLPHSICSRTSCFYFPQRAITRTYDKFPSHNSTVNCCLLFNTDQGRTDNLTPAARTQLNYCLHWTVNWNTECEIKWRKERQQ
jgi:hypothetical protein